MKIQAKRASILMIFLLMMQSIAAGVVPLQSVYAQGNANDTFFDFESITEGSFSQEDNDGFLEIDWSLAGFDIEEADQTVEFQSPVALTEQKGTLSLEEEAVDIASFETTEDVIRVTFQQAALEHPEAEGTLKLQVPLEEEEVVEEEITEESAEEGTEEAVKEEAAEEETEEAVKEEAAEEGTEEAVKEETAEEKGTEEAVEEEETEEVVKEEDSEKENAATSAAVDVQPQADLGNIFTFKSFQLNGEEIEDGAVIEIGDGTKVQVEYTWETENNAAAGDTASIQLPDVFQQVNISNQPIVTDGVTVGTYHIQNGVLQFIFNEAIEDGAVQNGIVGLNLQFDLEKFQEDIEQEIKFNDKSDKKLTVIAKPSGDISGITKEGHPDRDLNAREIIWTVDVMNDNSEPITDAVLEDIIPKGLGEPRDFVVNELSAGLDGSKNVGAEVNVSPHIDGSKFTIGFDNFAAYKGYRVQYKTTIEDYSIDSFTNDATFSYGDTELPAEATVFAGERSNPIEKSGSYNNKTGQIDWRININESGGEIDKAIIHDNLPEELILTEGSLEIHKFDGNWRHIETTTADTFPINLGKVASNEIYQITFSTDIDWSKVNNGQFQSLNAFTNQTELHDGDIKIGEDEATVEFKREVLLKKSGKANVDYTNKTLSWTIDVNQARHPINNAVITDLIPKGLTISKDDIVITADGDTVEPKSIAINPIADGDNAGKTEVEINLGDIGSKHIKITYMTGIEDFKENSFKNTASLNGDGIGEESTEVETPINVPANSFAKKFTGINYNEKTINWQLTVNPIREAMTELEIVDTFPNKGMILLPDTLKVTAGKDPLERGTDYTLVPNGDGYHEGFKIELDKSRLPLNAQLEVTYQTSYDPQREVDENTPDPHEGEGQARVYKNHAQFTGKTKSGEFSEGRDAQTRVREDSWNSGKKEGQLVRVNGDGELVNGWKSGSERKIAWQLYTNYQQQNLGEGIVISDTLQYEGTIDEASIVVKTYDVAANGNTTIKGEALSPENYSINVEGNTFTLTFADDFAVKDRYVVQFTTSVPDISQRNYTNKATVTVGDKSYPYSGTVNYDKHNNFLEKGPVGLEGNDVFTGEEIDWQVKVNESLSIIKNPVITDTISTGLVYVEDSLKITAADGSVLAEGKDYTLDATEADGGETVLTIKITNTMTGTLTLNYTTVVTKTDGEVNNTVELSDSDVETKPVESQRLNAKQFSWVDGEFNPKRGAIKITKIDPAEKKTIANNEATFKLSYDLNGERVQFGEKFTTENGVLNIGNLPLRTYYLEEVASPNGYVLSDEVIEIAVDKPYGKDENVYEIDFENTKEKITVTGTKVWEGGPKPSIELQLHRNGEPYGEPVALKDGKTEYTWSDLDKTDIDGKEYQYTVDEVEVPDNYEKTISDDGLTITNNFVTGETNINVAKVWKDAENQDGIRPESITVILLENGEETEQSLVLNENNNWEGAFTELPLIDQTGTEITYTVKEVTVDGYETEIAGNAADGYVITNTHAPELINLEGTKTWNDAENQDGKRPESITIRLLANGEEVESAEVSEETDWSYVFKELPKFENGEEINYTIQEDNVEDYSTEINGLNIINSYTPEQTSINVVKAWEDANNQDGARPESITVKLVANGEETGQELILNEANNWQGDFIELDVYADGEKIQYSIEEAAVEGYETETAGNPSDGYVITNTHEPERIDLEGTKTWNDADNQDGKRPDTITVRLLANGAELDAVEVSEETDWSYAFTDLPKFENGEEINYTVREDNVEDYSAVIDGMDITNSYTPEQTSINVVKIWNDENNKAGARPDSITVKLLANGEETGQEVTLSKDTNWQGDFLGLDVYVDGDLIEYTVEEEDVPNYQSNVTADGENVYNFTVTNNYDPAKVCVGDYVWIDVNKDGLQDEADIPIKGVVLTIEDEEGNTVTDVYGNPAGPTTTDKNGYYIFENLPIDKTYIVRIDREASAEALKGYVPTLEEAGDDRSIDSSLWFAVSRHLTEDGEHDPTLDFGFVKADPEEPNEPEEPGKEPGKDPDKEPGEEPGKDSGENPDKEPGEEPGKDSGENPDKEPGADPGKDSGENPSKGSGEASAKTDAGDSKGTDEKDGEALPDTATSMFNLLLISLGLLTAGTILVIINRFRKRSSN